MPIDVKENLKKLEISRCTSSRNDKQSCKNFFKNYQAIVSLYTKNIREYSIAIFEKGHRWKPNFWPNWYPGGSKLSKKSTFKFRAKCMGREASSGTCGYEGFRHNDTYRTRAIQNRGYYYFFTLSQVGVSLTLVVFLWCFAVITSSERLILMCGYWWRRYGR